MESNKLMELLKPIINHPRFKQLYLLFAIIFCVSAITYTVYVVTHANACTCLIINEDGNTITNYISDALGMCANQCESLGGIVINNSDKVI